MGGLGLIVMGNEQEEAEQSPNVFSIVSIC
jgi:hypothetical protein